MPRPQLRRAQEEVPGGQAWPPGQVAQKVEPRGFAKVPPGQREHEVAIEALLKEPGGHKIHSREVTFAKVPVEQEKG